MKDEEIEGKLISAKEFLSECKEAFREFLFYRSKMADDIYEASLLLNKVSESCPSQFKSECDSLCLQANTLHDEIVSKSRLLIRM